MVPWSKKAAASLDELLRDENNHHLDPVEVYNMCEVFQTVSLKVFTTQAQVVPTRIKYDVALF